MQNYSWCFLKKKKKVMRNISPQSLQLQIRRAQLESNWSQSFWIHKYGLRPSLKCKCEVFQSLWNWCVQTSAAFDYTSASARHRRMNVPPGDFLVGTELCVELEHCSYVSACHNNVRYGNAITGKIWQRPSEDWKVTGQMSFFSA